MFYCSSCLSRCLSFQRVSLFMSFEYLLTFYNIVKSSFAYSRLYYYNMVRYKCVFILFIALQLSFSCLNHVTFPIVPNFTGGAMVYFSSLNILLITLCHIIFYRGYVKKFNLQLSWLSKK